MSEKRVQAAHSVLIDSCPHCDGIHIKLLDPDGDVFAVGILPASSIPEIHQWLDEALLCVLTRPSIGPVQGNA